MRSRTDRQFWTHFSRLPPEVQQRAREAFSIWVKEPDSPKLQFKRVSRVHPLYSVRITKRYRAVGVLRGDEVTWMWVGPHDAYLRFIRTFRVR